MNWNVWEQWQSNFYWKAVAVYIFSSIYFKICIYLEGSRTLWLKFPISDLWFWTCFFPLFNLCSCTDVNPHKLYPCLEIIWLLLFLLFLLMHFIVIWQSKGENVSECVRVACLISATVRNISGWKGMQCSSQTQMFNFKPSYCREVLFRKSKLWRNLTEDKNNRRRFKSVWKYSILVKHWKWE